MTEFSKPIHGARGCFAFSVLVYHIYASGLPPVPMPWFINELFDSMKYGVELFFAISGFVIIGTMQRARSPLQFMGDRATRIYPVLWATLPIAILSQELRNISPFEGYNLIESIGLMIGNMLALGHVFPVPVIFGVAWTLSYELSFYLLGFIVLLGRRRGMNLVWLALAIGLCYCIFKPRALYFLAGVLVATGMAERSPLRYLSHAPGLCLLAFLGFWQATSNETSPHIDPIYQWTRDFHWLTGPLAFLSATAAINGFVHGRGLSSRVLQSAPLLWLGTISFSLYMWHTLILGTVKAAMYKFGLPEMLGAFSQPAFLLLVLPPCLIISAISARLLEGKVTAMLRRRVGWGGAPHGVLAKQPQTAQ